MVHDVTPLVPLSIDRVYGGDPITSSLPILQLPVELISHIVPHLSPADIQNLALVDRDTNQLARTLQFTHVKLNYSNCALDLLASLRQEVQLSHHPKRCIGSCIRRLTVSNVRGFSNNCEGMNVEGQRALPLQYRFQCIKSAQLAEADYLRNICDLLPRLPNLYVLEWNDEGPLTSEVIRSMMSSSLVCLRLNGPILNSPFALPSPPDGVNWALETLFLNIHTLIPGNAMSFISQLLQLTAPTLRQLAWLGYVDRQSAPCRTYVADVHFPVLRDIVLDQVNFEESKFLQTVLGNRASIRSLSVNSSPTVSRFLAQRGRIPSLASFKWNWCNQDSYDNIIQFIHDNWQLSSLEFTSPLPLTTVDYALLQGSSPRFDNLVILRLISEGYDFPNEVLKTIALTKSLRHLWLSAGAQFGVRHHWAVDHPLMIDTLRPLTRLKTLVLTRDSYRVDGHPLLDTSIECYYVNKVLPHDISLEDYLTEEEWTRLNNSRTSFDHSLRLRDSLRSLAWERWHQSQMAAFTKEYLKDFRHLKWCFIGQLPMRVEDGPSGRIVEPDIQERDPALTVLHTYWDCDVREQ